MAVTTTKTPLTGLARMLVLEGLLSEQDAQQAIQTAQDNKVALVAHLVDKKLVSGREVAHAASAEFGVPVIDINAVDIDPEAVKLVKEEVIRRHHALPLFKRGSRLFIAISDPTNLKALDEIRFQVGGTTEPILVEEDKLNKVMEKALEATESGLGDMDDAGLDDLEGLDVGLDQKEDKAEDSDIDDAPVVRFVNKVLLDAIKKGASDLHFEPYEKTFRVRLRIDGILTELAKPPVALANKIAARIKVMSRLDVSERRVPQDGRIKLKVSKNKAIDFRVSTCPTLYGEKVVLRILDSDSSRLSIDVLGYEEDQKKIYLENLQKPYGMFLVTGPTGSGKTVSLYTGINILNTIDINISTAEDPVEINLPGVNQVQVDEKTGMTFAKALKAFLRQDPDVILVGEIRDLETASIAVKAAQTGHMVMSTLHTNDGPQTLTRLMDMGVPPFAVATTINLIIAQRLTRKLCTNCKRPVEIPADALRAEGFTEAQLATNFRVYQAVGCDMCNGGYKGRTGIYQVMPISDSMKRLIMEGANAITLADQAQKEGVPNIRQSALKKVMDGITSIEEINSVTME
ncbi:MAG: Type II secretion system protein E [Gammaproteobacteria bacterium]|nr:Type II secretion system protein E [Gammaproteobacteria bacterium]